MGRSQGGRATERSLRSLVNLQANASTARTLNLIAIWQRSGEIEAYQRQPFFRTPTLNRSIIVKHRLRPNEREDFSDGRSSATKVILPIDITNLRAGARSFFVGQIGYTEALQEVFELAGERSQYDADLLTALDALPSLDPFLMRERLKKSGFHPARLYFDLTEADTARVFQFAKTELLPLIGLTGLTSDLGVSEKAAKLATKILANDGDSELEPLRLGMGLDKATFDEGIFCWKGFIYYKWTLNELLPKVPAISTEIGAIRATGPVNNEDAAFISACRERLTRAITKACRTVRTTLKVYDDAYVDLTANSMPLAFREFLLNAPSLFHELGERLGAVQHIVSFWRYRFPEGTRRKIDGEELIELLTDFEFSLSFNPLATAA